MSDTLSFQGGTLVISQRPQSDPPGSPFQWIKSKVLNEGIDVPEAKIARDLGLSHQRVHQIIQRWG